MNERKGGMVTAIIQARMGATRLPGKVLLPLGDTTVLGHTIRRVQAAKRIRNVVVATTDKPLDAKVAEFCEMSGIDVFRGSESDVLDRYYRAALQFGAKSICRITADCPLIDPGLIDEVIGAYEEGKYDYVSTGTLSSTYPDGMDTEVFSYAALERAWREAKKPSEREHVTPYLWNHPELFRIKILSDGAPSPYRITLDEPRDYEVIKRIVADVADLSLAGIVQYLRTHPEVAAINAPITRNEGYAKSVVNDQKA